MIKSRWNSSKEQWEANEFFRIFTHGKYEEKSYQEKEKQQQPQKKPMMFGKRMPVIICQ